MLGSIAAGTARSAERVSPPHPSTPSPLQGFSASLPRITPERFGAKGNGSADDAGAINKAFAFLKAAGGGTLSFTAGKKYLVKSSVGSGPTNRFIDNVTVEGNGATIKNGGPSQPSSARFYTMRVLGSNVTIRNLNFGWTHHFSFTTDYFDPKGNGAGEVNALDVGGYYPTAKSNVLVDHVKVYGSWYSGIRPRYASHVTVRNCYVQQALATAIFPGDVIEDVVVDHCKTTDSKDDGIYIGVGKAHPAARNVKVIHCSVKNSWARGIGFGGVNGGLIEDNAIDNTYVAGITLDWSGSYSPEGTQNVIIRNNRIRNAGWNYKGMRAKFWARASSVPHGIYSFTGGTTGKIASIEIVSNEITHIRGSGIALAGLQRVSIRDNRITDATDGGIAIGFDASPNSRSVQDFTLSNNRIENVGGNGIYLSHASDGTVDDNTVRTYGKKGGRVDRGIMVYRCEGITLGSNEIANTHGAEERLTLNESRNVHQKPNTSSSNPR